MTPEEKTKLDEAIGNIEYQFKEKLLHDDCAGSIRTLITAVETLKAENERLNEIAFDIDHKGMTIPWRDRYGDILTEYKQGLAENERLRLSEAEHALQYKFMQDENESLRAELTKSKEWIEARITLENKEWYGDVDTVRIK